MASKTNLDRKLNQSGIIADRSDASEITRVDDLPGGAVDISARGHGHTQNFVTMEYFGFPQRDPEDCHASMDPANCGYIFHNSRFNTPGADPDLIENIIVRGFIESPEYRGRFGP